MLKNRKKWSNHRGKSNIKLWNFLKEFRYAPTFRCIWREESDIHMDINWDLLDSGRKRERVRDSLSSEKSEEQVEKREKMEQTSNREDYVKW